MESLIRDPSWFFPLSHLRKNTRSRLDGVTFDRELEQQSKAVQFVTKMAAPLRLPPQTIFAASLFLHRYYIRYSLQKVHPYQVAAACVFLACKTEESPRKLREVASVATKAALKLPADMSSQDIEVKHEKDITQWTQVIRSKEDELLQALKFDFEDTTPYEHLNKLVNSYVPPEHHNLLGSTAMLFINDSCLTLLSLSYPMPHLAVAALYWAAKSTNTIIPDVNHEKWYASHLSRPQIVKIINDMADMIPVVCAYNKIGMRNKYEKIK